MIIFDFIIGLVTGSFLAAAIYRLPEKISIYCKRSFCPHCYHQLVWKDLLPLFSYIFLKGRCRYCNKKISALYPFIEVLTALIFMITGAFNFSISAYVRFIMLIQLYAAFIFLNEKDLRLKDLLSLSLILFPVCMLMTYLEIFLWI